MIALPAFMEEIKPFYAVEVFQAADALARQGRSIVHLGFGEPDFPTPQAVQDAAIKAMQAGRTRYTHSLGIPELREAICAHHQSKYGVTVHPDQVLVSMGTSLLTQLLMTLLLEPGDEVILSDPTYACYANFVRIARGTPVFVRTEERDGFQLRAEAVRRAITPRTRAIMVCSPSNPTGVALKPDVLAELAELGVPIVSDEIYHGLNYAGRDRSVLEFTDEAFVLNGFSKYFAMTGWRLGYLIFPRPLSAQVMKLHQNVVISATDFVQYAGIAALTEAAEVCEGYRAEFDKRRLYMIQRLGEIGLPLHYEPTGAFYCFADASAYGRDSLQLAMEILEQAGVTVTPGIDFGAAGEGYLRLSYANSLENIAEALDRLQAFLQERG